MSDYNLAKVVFIYDINSFKFIAEIDYESTESILNTSYKIDKYPFTILLNQGNNDILAINSSLSFGVKIIDIQFYEEYGWPIPYEIKIVNNDKEYNIAVFTNIVNIVKFGKEVNNFNDVITKYNTIKQEATKHYTVRKEAFDVYISTLTPIDDTNTNTNFSIYMFAKLSNNVSKYISFDLCKYNITSLFLIMMNDANYIIINNSDPICSIAIVKIIDVNTLDVCAICSTCKMGKNLMNFIETLKNTNGELYKKISLNSVENSKGFYDKLGYKETNREGGLISMEKNLQQNGGRNIIATKNRIIIKGRSRIIYIGPKGGRYIKSKGNFVRI